MRSGHFDKKLQTSVIGGSVDYFFSILYAIYFFIASAAYLPVAFLLWLFAPAWDPDRARMNAISNWYMYRVLTISPFWHFHFEGLENLPKAPYMIVSNHQSFADIVVLAGLPISFRWVSKSGVFMVPIFGWLLYLNGHIALRRGDFVSTRTMLRRCCDVLSRGLSILMFPEGTRSIDGKVQAFKEGPFRVAKQMGVPIVPIAVTGTRGILAKGAKKITFRADVTIRVLAPYVMAPTDDPAVVRDLIRDEIARTVEPVPLRSRTAAA